MVDLTEHEKAAIRASMKLTAEIMEEIGWETRLAELSEAQVRTLIETAISGFQDAMRAIAQGSAGTREDAEVPF